MARRSSIRVDRSAHSSGYGSSRGRRVKVTGRKRRGQVKKRIHIKPHEWVSHFVRIKNGDTSQVENLEFSQRPYLHKPYDSHRRKILLVSSRQAEKSTTVANKLMAQSNMRALYTSLFVSPSAMQTTVFSKTRIDEIVEISPLLKAMKNHDQGAWNILEKSWVNRSKIYLRYAFLNADRIRGLSVNAIFGDEIQDLLQDVMPVIEESASHHKDPLFLYSGTPKTFDNTIEDYWSKHSTQNEWCVPCERHGTPNRPSTWHWNILGPDNIDKKGVVCSKCKKLLVVEHPMARWVSMRPGAEWEGYRICRLMVPWFQTESKWKEILDTRERYPTAQFHNEVLALSYDSGTKPLTQMDMRLACDDEVLMDEEIVARLRSSHELYMGIDWGEGTTSFTVVTMGGYTRSDDGFQILFSKRFTGPLSDPLQMMEEIHRLIGKFRPKYIGTDYGAGFHQNKQLSSKYGPARIHTFQYAAKQSAKFKYSPQMHKYIVFRSPVMADIFSAIKNCKIRFPNWKQYKEPYVDDCLSIRSSYSNTQRQLVYDKTAGRADDTFHTVLYCFLASMLDHRRPDIIAPLQNANPAEEEARANEEAAAAHFDILSVT